MERKSVWTSLLLREPTLPHLECIWEGQQQDHATEEAQGIETETTAEEEARAHITEIEEVAGVAIGLDQDPTPVGVESPHADVTDPTPPADTNHTNLVLHQNKLERFSNLCRLIIINLPLSCVFFIKKVPPTVNLKRTIPFHF